MDTQWQVIFVSVLDFVCYMAAISVIVCLMAFAFRQDKSDARD